MAKSDGVEVRIGTNIEQFSLLGDYVGKKISLRLVTGQPIIGTLVKVSAYEILVELGSKNVSGTKNSILIFKHGIMSLALAD